MALNSSHSAVLVSNSQGRNSITGFVFGESRTPLAETYVQLLDELGTMISQVRTTGSGRYAFYGLSSGRFKVRVFPVGPDLLNHGDTENEADAQRKASHPPATARWY